MGHSTSETLRSLYSEHHGWLLGWLRKRLGCSQQAADLAQDTYLQVLRKQTALEIREPRAYLSTIAHGLVVNHWRRLELERAYLDALGRSPDAVTPSLEHRALVLETLYQIDAMLSALPDKVRTAFLLAQLDGLKYAQIAARLRVSERMVKKYMASAMLQCLTLMDSAAA